MRRAVAGKARVHELAKELGVTSKEVLARLNEQGEFVKSASSTVEAPVARRLRQSFGGGKPAPEKALEQATVNAAAPAAAKAAAKGPDASLEQALDKAVGNGEATAAPAAPAAPAATATPAETPA